jgi:hypothetical protein
MDQAELDRFESQAAEIVGAAKGLFDEFEARLAQALNDQKLTNAQTRDDAVQLRKVLQEVVASSKAVVDAREREGNRIVQEWKTLFQDLARKAGQEQAQAFGESLSAGLRKDISALSKATQQATGRLQWSSILSWAVGVALAIPLTIAIGVWALLPSVEGVDPLRVRVAMAFLEPCEIKGKTRVCFPVDDNPELVRRKDGRELTAVRGL